MTTGTVMASGMSALKKFLEEHRTNENVYSLLGMGNDAGKYNVEDAEYDHFLQLVHQHIYSMPPRALSLIERHKEHSHILVDLDFRYEETKGGPLIRHFNHDQVQTFIAMYIAAMIYFTRVENLEDDLIFYDMVKPAPETDKNQHKDGIHIQCPTLNTTPKFQHAIRGFLLANETITKVFGNTNMSNTAEDCFDKSVIYPNGWFLYECCKPDKSQYNVAHIWKVDIADIQESLGGVDPDNFVELVDIVKDMMTNVEIPTSPLDIMKTLSIRRGANDLVEPDVRERRAAEWEDVYAHWGQKTKTVKRATPATTRVPATVRAEGGAEAASGTENELTLEEVVVNAPVETSEEDIKFAYRLCKECINPERRAGEYSDWVTLAFCLKNIADTEESYQAWVDVTRRVDASHKKKTYTEDQLRSRWSYVKLNGSRRPIRIASLVEWAKEDNPEKLRSIRSETITLWIINYANDTHVDLAELVHRLYKHEFRCSVGRKLLDLYHYNTEGSSWKRLRTNNELRCRLSDGVKNEIYEAIREIGRQHNATNNQADRDRADERMKKLGGIARQLKMSGFKDSVLKESQEKFYDEDFTMRLDCDPDIIGVSNGVLVLNYHEKEDMSDMRVLFRKGRPDDNISFQMGRMDPDLDPIPYEKYRADDPDQAALMGFFKLIYPDDDLREYVLTLLASCLEGRNKEQKFWINTGGGSNGKSMLQTLMEYTFGDYQTSLQTTVLTRKRPESGAANPDMITTKCKRYIYMGEPDPGEKINTSRMKQLSGEDRIEARGLFSDQEKFNMMGKMFLSCNDLPPISSMDNGTWRRIRVIPHKSTFKDPGSPDIDPKNHIYEKDMKLKIKLKNWRVAFLGLLVEYYNKYLKEGLREPPCVLAASNKYKERNDVFMSFFNEHYIKQADAGPVTLKQVRLDFREWKKKLGREVDLKETLLVERMKAECGNNSTDKEFYGIVPIEEDDTDLSGAPVAAVAAPVAAPVAAAAPRQTVIPTSR
jgi:P4 family phage/plasmid primase-like protien